MVNSTKGPVSMSKYKGKWIVLFSHPGNFTPVCTTEFMEFARSNKEFKDLNVELLVLSVDSPFSHIEWLKDIKDKFGIEVPFPVIADINKDVAREYNLLDEKIGSTAKAYL
ncbi:MAG: redoxin domain-containing protein [Ferroplasma sp.]